MSISAWATALKSKLCAWIWTKKKIDFKLVKKEAASKKVGGAPVKKKRRKKPAK
jgi:hypothetical protein